MKRFYKPIGSAVILTTFALLAIAWFTRWPSTRIVLAQNGVQLTMLRSKSKSQPYDVFTTTKPEADKLERVLLENGFDEDMIDEMKPCTFLRDSKFLYFFNLPQEKIILGGRNPLGIGPVTVSFVSSR